MLRRSSTTVRWFRAAIVCASLAAAVALLPGNALAKGTEPLDGVWVGQADLECTNFGDSRPPVKMKAEFVIERGELGGRWTTPNGEHYEVKGTLGDGGKIVDGSASNPNQLMSIKGAFGADGAKGTAKGSFPGNLQCAGPWQASLDAGASASSDDAPSAPRKAVAERIDGVWRGSASLECSNMGDPRPGITADIEMRVSDGKVSGAWSTSTGERYEIKGAISDRGALSKAAARLDPAVLGLTGNLKGEAGAGAAKGVVSGNLSCQGSWTVALAEPDAAPAHQEAPAEAVVAKVESELQPETPPSKVRKSKESADEATPVTRKKKELMAEAPVEPAEEQVAAVSPDEPEPEPVAEPAPKLSFSPGRYVALVIGNNDYDDLPDLRTAVNDAAAMAQVLEDRYGFEATVLKNASRKDVLSAMAKLRATLDYDSSLLIYYAGHGHVDEVTERGYWLPVDSERDDPSNWISTADITDMLKASPARAVLVIADSCYSGTLTRAAPVKLPSAEKREAFIKRMVAKRARTVFASGGVEPVEDGGGGKHSVFAKALLDTLKENAEVIDAQSLFAPVRHQVVLNADQTPEYSDVRLAGHECGDFVFVPRQ